MYFILFVYEAQYVLRMLWLDTQSKFYDKCTLYIGWRTFLFLMVHLKETISTMSCE